MSGVSLSYNKHVVFPKHEYATYTTLSAAMQADHVGKSLSYDI
jgi:hypothetical protein